MEKRERSETYFITSDRKAHILVLILFPQEYLKFCIIKNWKKINDFI